MLAKIYHEEKGSKCLLESTFFLDVGLLPLPHEACATPRGEEGGQTRVGSLPAARQTNNIPSECLSNNIPSELTPSRGDARSTGISATAKGRRRHDTCKICMPLCYWHEKKTKCTDQTDEHASLIPPYYLP
jgi:hypothetical protein